METFYEFLQRLRAPARYNLRDLLQELKPGRTIADQRFLDDCIRRLDSDPAEATK